MDEDSMDPNARIALAEIKGDIKLVLSGQERTNSDIVDIRQNVRDHGSRINVLENDKYKLVGERQGVAVSTKVFWAIITAIAAVIATMAGFILSAM